MTLKRLIILLILITIIFSFNAVSASDSNFDINNTNDKLNLIYPESNDELFTQQTEDVQNNLQDSSDVDLQSSEEYVIHVGTNSTPNGTGTKEDPFANLELACKDVNSGEEKSKVTVNIDDGIYLIGSYLKFNTSNLNINGTGSNVILKNLDSQSFDAQLSFGLIPNTGNFTMSNIIFDASSYINRNTYNTDNGWFTPFAASADYYHCITYNNCLFVGNNMVGLTILPHSASIKLDDYIFNNCKFVNYTELGNFKKKATGSVSFNYCIFSEFSMGLGLTRNTMTVTFDSCWLGHNNGYTKTFFMMSSYYPDLYENGFEYRDVLINNPLTYRHAILEVSENYLGDNTYELVGKLMWNDSTNDDIDKLGSMTVYLSAGNGNIPSTATLENGTFNVIYTSESDYHEIEVVLDNQKIKLNNKINFTLNAPTINYGDNQNITVTFPSNVNGTVYVTVNNKTYRKYCDNQNYVTVTIDDILTKGNYSVDVSFAHDKNEFDVVLHGTTDSYYTVEEIDSFGFNTTKLTINGLTDYEFNSTVTPNSLYIGDNATVTLSLPDGANGTVTIKVGDNEAKTFNVNETITIDGFIAGKNVVNITYNGNDIYDAKSVVKNISALNKPAITIPEIDAGKATTTTITLPENATGNVTVFVDGKEYSVVPLTNGSATVTIPELPAGKHNVTISYSGDGNYSGFAQTSAVEVKEPVKPTPKPDDQKPATVKKTATKITAKKKTFKAKKKVKKYTITLKAGKKAVKKVQVILKIGKKTYKAKTNAKGKATFKIKKLTKKGKYNAKIIFKGNKLYKASSKKVKITVKK